MIGKLLNIRIVIILFVLWMCVAVESPNLVSGSEIRSVMGCYFSPEGLCQLLHGTRGFKQVQTSMVLSKPDPNPYSEIWSQTQTQTL